MIEILVSESNILSLHYAIFDYNGTLATDGILSDEVKKRISSLSQLISVQVLTADTFGRAAEQLANLPCKLHILQKGNEAQQKLDYINELGVENVVCFGNGNNDRLMLKNAALGIVVIGGEGCSGKALQAADIIVRNINEGIDLLLNPLRLKATLRD